jgi:predicted double-glycine peptidase
MLTRFNAQYAKLLFIFGSIVGISCAHAEAILSYASLKEIREQGIVMQQWENSCAAASIATVLTYGFRDPVSEAYAAGMMLEQTDVKKVKAQGGFSLLDLKNFVESRGYVGRAYKSLGFDDLKVFHAPIVPIDVKGYNHYVILNGSVGNTVHFADPAFGHRTMTIPEFEKIWLGGMAFIVTRKETTQ